MCRGDGAVLHELAVEARKLLEKVRKKEKVEEA